MILLNKSIMLTAVGCAILILDLGAYTATAVVNPGIPDRDLRKYNPEYVQALVKAKEFGYCSRCKMIRRPGKDTQHCLECDVCVEGYDHHCPWTGKCIGRGNYLFFQTFLVSTFVLLFYIMGATVIAVR